MNLNHDRIFDGKSINFFELVKPRRRISYSTRGNFAFKTKLSMSQ